MRERVAAVGRTAASSSPGRAGGDLAPHGQERPAAGEDFAAGELLVPAGRRLRPGDLAAAAAGGHATLAVARRPVVAIIPTGDEIRPVGIDAAAAATSLDTNSLMLAARCRQLGAVRRSARCSRTTRTRWRPRSAAAAHDADLVLVIAGSSRGRGDHAAAVLAQVGGVAVAGVAVRPGHPALLGHAKRPRRAARSAGPGSPRSSACPGTRWRRR